MDASASGAFYTRTTIHTISTTNTRTLSMQFVWFFFSLFSMWLLSSSRFASLARHFVFRSFLYALFFAAHSLNFRGQRRIFFDNDSYLFGILINGTWWSFILMVRCIHYLSGIDVPMHSFIGVLVLMLRFSERSRFHFVLNLFVRPMLSSVHVFFFICHATHLCSIAKAMCIFIMFAFFLRFTFFCFFFWSSSLVFVIGFLCIFVFHPSSCHHINIQLTIALYVRAVYCFVFILLLLFTTILINVFLMEYCFKMWKVRNFLAHTPTSDSWVKFTYLQFVVAKLKKKQIPLSISLHPMDWSHPPTDLDLSSSLMASDEQHLCIYKLVFAFVHSIWFWL